MAVSHCSLNRLDKVGRSLKAEQHRITYIEVVHESSARLNFFGFSYDISNCVINIAPEKELVFVEAYRVLKPGEGLAISDAVAFKDLDEEIKLNPELLAACIAGTSSLNVRQQIYRASRVH